MRNGLVHRMLRLCLIALCIGVVVSVVVIAQGAAAPIEPTAALKDLTAEVRRLRVAVEEATRAQTQTQALGVYLTVEQGRIVQVASRLESARRELEELQAASRRLTADLAALESMLSREADPESRRAIEMRQRATKQELDEAGSREQQIRSRETEATQAMQVEEARWSDLISKLEEIIKK
jgi:DNA repair exonuclease SbcCD ATPase subunit